MIEKSETCIDIAVPPYIFEITLIPTNDTEAWHILLFSNKDKSLSSFKIRYGHDTPYPNRIRRFFLHHLLGFQIRKST